MDRISRTLENSRVKDRDEGFVLITALMVIFLIVSIVSMVAIITASDMRSAARARAIIKSRFVAESVSDSVFGAVANVDSNIFGEAILNFQTNGPYSGAEIDYRPLAKSPGYASPSGFGRWFYLAPDGAIELCDEAGPVFPVLDKLKDVCFKAQISQLTPSAPLKIEEVQLEIVSRAGCLVESTPPYPVRNCVYRNYTTTFRTRTFIEDVLTTNSEYSDLNGAPVLGGNPAKVAYLPSDSINGRIHTNDDGIFYCGNQPTGTFTNTALTNSATRIAANPADTFCQAASTAISNPVSRAAQFLAGQIDSRGSKVNNTVASSSVFYSLAGNPGANNPYNINSPSTPTTIFLERDGVTIGSTKRIYPPNGVIFVEGTAVVRGNYSKALSIYASGGVIINGSLIYESNRAPYPSFDGTGPTTSLPSDVILGIATPEDIEIECGAATSGGECADRNIVAVLNASVSVDDGNPNTLDVGGHVYNTAWKDSEIVSPAVTGAGPKLTLYGAIISYWHPVFGSYTVNSTEPAADRGTLKHGWRKSFTMDTRLIDTQPPYFFRTTQASVVRTNMVVSPCLITTTPASNICDIP